MKFTSTLTHAPLSFVRSGHINVGDGLLYYVGESGYGWSRAVESATLAYYLAMGPTDAILSYYANRWFGFPLRRLHEFRFRLKKSFFLA